METAGAEDIPEDAERKGLGTPATRAGIIEKLVQKGFMERKGDKKTRYLISTDKGNALITVMPEQIQSASMTADWEQKLLRMERGDYEAEDFMKEITEMISRLVQNYDAVKGADKANLFGEQRKGSPGRTLMTDHKRVEPALAVRQMCWKNRRAGSAAIRNVDLFSGRTMRFLRALENVSLPVWLRSCLQMAAFA